MIRVREGQVWILKRPWGAVPALLLDLREPGIYNAQCLFMSSVTPVKTIVSVKQMVQTWELFFDV